MFKPFTTLDYLRFYLNYLKLRVIHVWFETKTAKWTFFSCLNGFILGQILRIDALTLLYKSSKVNFVETIFGKFKIRPYTMDIINVAPSFEREDVDHTLKVISSELTNGNKVTFMDIGSAEGSYTVAIGNRYKQDDKVKIYAFEPLESSYGVLTENIKLNDLKNAVAVKALIHDKDDEEINFVENTEEPGYSGIGENPNRMVRTVTHSFRSKKLDSITPEWNLADHVLVIKLDVEGSEKAVMTGAIETLKTAKKVYLLVEDFVDASIIQFLDSFGFKFASKLTPYNSWWLLDSKAYLPLYATK